MTIGAMVLERDIEAAIVKWAESRGGVAVKLRDEQRGFPDRTILLPNGVVMFVEIKRPKKNKKYAMQEKWIDKLQAMGFVADFVESVSDVEELFTDYLT